jgi:hypothetical protein
MRTFEFQTSLWDGPEAGLQIFFAVGDVGKLPVSDEQAAKIMGVTLEEFVELEASKEGPRKTNGRLTVSDCSEWVEKRINNVAASNRSRRLERGEK